MRREQHFSEDIFSKSSDFIFVLHNNVSDTKKNKHKTNQDVVGTQNRIQTVTNEPKITNLKSLWKIVF